MKVPRSLRFWLITVAALVVLAATLALGAWQLGRGRQRTAAQQAIAQRAAMPPVTASDLLGGTPVLYRPVVLQGTWVAQRTVFLDNRQMRGRVGFDVVTPLLLDGGRAAVLVERGWVPRNFEHREQLPAIATPNGQTQVRGRIAPPPPKLYEFHGADGGPIRQNLDLARFRAETGLPLLEFAVQQTGDAADGMLREWPEPGTGAARNYGYAFQWWAMSALTIILYVWFQFIAPRRRIPHA